MVTQLISENNTPFSHHVIDKSGVSWANATIERFHVTDVVVLHIVSDSEQRRRTPFRYSEDLALSIEQLSIIDRFIAINIDYGRRCIPRTATGPGNKGVIMVLQLAWTLQGFLPLSANTNLIHGHISSCHSKVGPATHSFSY
jgi:hypothetical protein